MTVLEWMDSPGWPMGEWVMWQQQPDPNCVMAVSAFRPMYALNLYLAPSGRVEAEVVSTAMNVPGAKLQFEIPPDLDAFQAAGMASAALTDVLWKPFFAATRDFRVRRNPVMDIDTALLNAALTKVLADATVTDPQQMSILSTLLANDGGNSLQWYLENAGFSPDDIRFLIGRIRAMLANTDPTHDNLVSAVLAQDGGTRLADFLGNVVGSPESAGVLLDLVAQDAQNTDPARENLLSALMARDGGRRLHAYLEGASGALDKLVAVVQKITDSVDEFNPARENAISVMMAKDGGRRLKAYLKRTATTGFAEAIQPERVAIVAALIVVALALVGLTVSQVWIARARR